MADVSKPRTALRSEALVLMYHAVRGAHDELLADPHYSLPLDRFREQLDEVAGYGSKATCVRDWLAAPSGSAVLLTFDDGHASDRRLALPALLERGMRADFFINPANVGRRGFAGWPELREMAAAGMSIQSHGYDHRYFTALSPVALAESLRAARLEIEVRLGSPVSLLAPPGGRMPRDLFAIARNCGYSHVLGSHPGWLSSDALDRPLPRLAVTADVGERVFRQWLQRRRSPMLARRVRHGALSLAKSALGDDRYERIREHAFAWRRSSP